MINSTITLIGRLAIATGLVAVLSSCFSLISLDGPPVGDNPYLVDRSFSHDELVDGMNKLRGETGLSLAVESIDGVVNGYADVSELSPLEDIHSFMRHEPMVRALHLFEQRMPLLYTRSYHQNMNDAEFLSYHVPLVHSATFGPIENDFEVPEHTHLGLTYISVGATGGHDVIALLDFEQVRLGPTGFVRAMDTAAMQVETYMHPGIDRFPVPVDSFVTYPRASEGQRFVPELEPLQVRTIRRRLLPVERNGQIVGHRTFFEGYVIGDHNVYLALLLDSTESSAGAERSRSDYTGTVGAVVLVYETEEGLRAAIEGATDQEGYDLLTGYNAAGFDRDGRAEDGRRFEGRLTPLGRSGFGTTTFPDGRAVTGRYVADELVGIAIEESPNGDRLIGYWDGNVKEGEYVQVGLEGAVQIVEYREGDRVGARPYSSPLESENWIWLAEIVPDSEPHAVSVDAGMRLWQIGDSDVLIQDANGDQYTGPLRSSEPTDARIVYADGSEYAGEVIDRVPDGDGRLVTSDGVTLEGSFADGLPDGTMLRITEDTVDEVRYYEGRLVGKADAGEDEAEPGREQSISIEEYIRTATRAHREFVGAVRQQRIDDVLSTIEATVTISAQAAQAVADAMEEYNREAARQRDALAATQDGTPAPGPAMGRAWSSGVPDAAPGGQLSYLVEGAEVYYQQYLAAHRSGDTAAASESYRGHELTVRNAEQLQRQLREAGE